MGNQNISALLLFAMAALHCGISESMDSIKGTCNDVIRLPCKATDRTTYRYVIWYKMESPATPIIKRKNGEYTYFNITSVSLGEKEALELHNVQPSDSGEYRCFLGAEVGGRNDESFIRLNISECLHDVSTVYPSTMIPDDSCPAVEDTTVHWAVLCLSLFSMAKIILCIAAVGVCNRVIFSTARRKQEVRESKTGTQSSWKDGDSQKS